MKTKCTYFFISFFTSFIFAQPNCIVDVSVRHSTISIFTDSGDVYTFGENNYGQIGNGNNISQTNPVLSSEAKLFKSIVHSQHHSVGLTVTNQIYAWGNNTFGQLGNGTTIDSNVPVLVSEETDWEKIDVGVLHSVALKQDGTIWGWGSNGAYTISSTNDNLEYRTTPIQIGTLNDWVEVSGGGAKTYAIKSDGTLWGRGNNISYGIGLPLPYFYNDFTQIGTDSNWKTVKSPIHNRYSIGMKTNNTLWGWGDNLYGAVGLAGITLVNQPTQISNDTWIDFAPGISMAAGIKSDGTLWFWGNGAFDTFNNVIHPPSSLVPVQIGSENNWIKVAAGFSSLYAIRSDNTLWAWAAYNFNYVNNLVTSVTFSSEPTLIYQCLDLASTNENEIVNMVIYPNPTTEKIFWAQNIEVKRAIIYDILGKKVFDSTDVNDFIDVSSFASGNYLIRLEMDNELFYESKFIKKN